MSRRRPHPDNELIDEMQAESIAGAQQGSAGGNVSRAVGSRAELHEAEGTLEGDEVERALGSDNPRDDEMKGNKTFAKIRTGQQSR